MAEGLRLSLSQNDVLSEGGHATRKDAPPAYLFHSPLLLLRLAVSGEMWISVAECSFGATRMRVALQQQQRGWKEDGGISAPHCSHHHRRAPNDDVACVAKVVLSQPEFSCSCDSPLPRYTAVALHNKVSSFIGAIDFKGRKGVRGGRKAVAMKF